MYTLSWINKFLNLTNISFTSIQVEALQLFKYMCSFTKIIMTDESFLLVSLNEEKAKKLAQVLSNDTARKILDYLSKKDLVTETQIAKALKLPLSTVHYNLQHLVKSDLVNDEHFTYSEKGKQISHYSLSNKYVIIAPKKTEQLKEKLKKFLPVIFVTTTASLLIKYFWQPTLLKSFSKNVMTSYAEDAAVAGADMLARAPAVQEISATSNQEFAIWFLFGSVFALLIYFIWAEIILKKRKKKQ